MTNKILVLSENPPITYLNALNRVNLNCDSKFIPEDFSSYRGLLLIGGGDILPCFYGKADARNINFIRDKAEFSALKYFTENSLPVMGVCRGLQVLNVFFGGTLKTVNNHFGTDGKDAYHKVFSLSPEIFDIPLVNSYHRQAVDKLGKGGKPLLVSEDKIVEAVAFKENSFGVQFHPERLSNEVSDLFYGYFAEKVRRVPRVY